MILTSLVRCDRPMPRQTTSGNLRNKYKGESKVVLKPKSTEEVSKIVAYCVKEGIAITPQGGNTGLVGGSVPVYDEVILSLVRPPRRFGSFKLAGFVH